MDRQPEKTRHSSRRGYKRKYIPRPAIAEKCWLDEDIQFWLTGNYDIADESEEVQIMLELASELQAARIQWQMADARAACHESPAGKEREGPRHTYNRNSLRRGFEVNKGDS